MLRLTGEIYFSIQILDLWRQAKLEQVQAVKHEIKKHDRMCYTRTGTIQHANTNKKDFMQTHTVVLNIIISGPPSYNNNDSNHVISGRGNRCFNIVPGCHCRRGIIQTYAVALSVICLLF